MNNALGCLRIKAL